MRIGIARAAFWAAYPFVVLRFRWLEFRTFRKLAPTRWLSSGELIALDLENLEDQAAESFFTEARLSELADARDKLREKTVSGNRINLTVFVFLLAQYVSIELDVSIFGVSIKKAPGVTESLLCFLILSEFLISILSRNEYLLESTMKVIIQKITPPELKSIRYTEFFPMEQFGPYQPFNIPQIIPNAFMRAANINTAVFYLIAVLTPAAFLFYAGHIALIYNLWSQPQLGSLSKFLAVYLFMVLAINAAYALLVRVRMPYRDWTHNQVIELTRQFHPGDLGKRYEEAWGELHRERRRLLDLGYSAVGGTLGENYYRFLPRVILIVLLLLLLVALL